jgi:hypothetical protein
MVIGMMNIEQGISNIEVGCLRPSLLRSVFYIRYSVVRFSTQIAKKLQTKGLKVAGKEDTSEKDLQRPEG